MNVASLACNSLLVFLQFQLISCFAVTENLELQKSLKNELDFLLNEKNYDVKQRPQCGGSPLYVAIGMQIEGIDKISEVDMDYTLTFDIHQRWIDDRLIFKNENLSNISVTLDNRVIQQVWVPDIYLSNDKKAYMHEITRNNNMLRLQPGGVVHYGLRITAELECKMNLARYPLDQQVCWLELESYGYANDEIRFQLIDGSKNSVTGLDNIKLAQFELLHFNINIATTKFARGDHSAAILSFTLQRNLGYFILQTYVPSSLLTILSWISFWIDYKCTSARFALGITSILAITTISNSSRKSLPKIPDIKALDVYLIACFAFVIFGIMEYVFLNGVNYANIRSKEVRKQHVQETKNKKRGKKNVGRTKSKVNSVLSRQTLREKYEKFVARTKKPFTLDQLKIDDVTIIDQFARIVFPSVFFLFNCFYWTYYNFF